MADDATSSSLWTFVPNSLDGRAAPLGEHAGKVALVVNVASACGLTPQYEALQSLYVERSGDGLVVLGFPCNDFGGQESGAAQAIQAFCSSEYGVTFPLYEKVQITTDPPAQSPIYSFLEGATGERPGWNFGKYLVGRDGEVIAYFGPRVAPDSAELVDAIDRALATAPR